MRPTISDYLNVFNGAGGGFRTLGEVAVERDVWGVPQFVAGNSGVVFRCAGGRFLKLYIRPNRHLRAIYDYVEQRRPPLLPPMRLLRDEAMVHTPAGECRVDVVEGRWSEGETLAAAVARAVRRRDRAMLGKLACSFDSLWDELQRQEWAHGDLKPENIIVGIGIDQLKLQLIDADAMWIPSLAGESAAELGTPPWRDEGRGAERFDKSIDLIPARRIGRMLRELAENGTDSAKFSLSLRP